MELYINSAADRTLFMMETARTFDDWDNGLFQSELAGALGRKPSESMVVISPKIEEKMHSDPEYFEELAQKINELLQNQGSKMKDCIVIVNRDGEISQHCLRSDREKHPTAEELREVAKARARRKARLDAYFHALERAAIKRKLVEQENAKRFLDKKKRLSVSALDMMARTHQIKNPPAFTSRMFF